MKAKESQKRVRRAESAEQKEARRALILRVAAAEVDAGADDFTIADLAVKAGLAKGTVYLYFSSKEAILGALTIETFTSVLRDLLARLGALPRGAEPSRTAFAVYEALSVVRARRLLHSLTQRRHDNREAFEKEVLPLVDRCDQVFREVYPGLEPGDGRIILRYGWALCLGISEILLTQGSGWKREEMPHPPGYTPLRMESGVVDGLTLIIEGYLRRRGIG